MTVCVVIIVAMGMQLTNLRLYQIIFVTVYLLLSIFPSYLAGNFVVDEYLIS